MKRIILSIIIISIALSACTSTIVEEEHIEDVNNSIHPIQLPGKEAYDDILLDLRSLPIQTLDDGTSYLIHPDKLASGGPPRDGIPSIDNPQYDLVADADEWLEDNDTLLFLKYNGVQKAYPAQIMVWHEIVNDYAAGIPVAITFCPLCGTGIAYERIVDNRESQLGTSGQLFNSNLVMYDRLTNSLWTQIDGVAIQGEQSGEVLTQIPLDVIIWQDLKKQYPTTLILNKDTGHERTYGTNPYIAYYTDDTVWFPPEFQKFSINTKEVVYGIEINGEYKAYKESDINQGAIQDVIKGVPLRIARDKGVINTTNLETGEELIEERHFWFSWYAFHPDTKLYGEE